MFFCPMSNNFMSAIDFTSILNNISQSLRPVEALVAGVAYVFGILFVISGCFKLTKIRGVSREGTATALACILGGVALIYLPSSITVLSTTFFGTSNILQYTSYNTYSIYGSVKLLIQTSGLIWFVRGCVLLIHAAEPGKQHGMKGVLFVIAGILSMNLDYTVYTFDALATYLIGLTTKIF